MELYIENADKFAKKFRDNLNNSREGEFLVRKSSEVSNILGESVYDMPAIEYAGKIKFANVHSVVTLDTLVRKMYANYLNWDEKRKKQRNLLLFQLFLPFAFWAFRGIETFFLFLSEVLQIIGIKSYKIEGKSLQILSAIGGVVGFLGSIASILSLFGFSFSHNGQ